MAVNGSVVSVVIAWDCDLDKDFLTHCRPEYRFRRLEDPKSKIAPGWNFRHAEYYSDSKRTLYKSTGILFVVNVQGQAGNCREILTAVHILFLSGAKNFSHGGLLSHPGKFSFIPFAVNLGAGLALLSIATIVCDVVVLYFMKDRRVYYDKKYLQVSLEN